MRLVIVGIVLAAGLPGLSNVARADDSSGLYDVAATAPRSLAKGAEGTLSVKITTKNGGEIHKEPPLSLALSTPGHLTISKAKLGKADATFSGETVSFSVPFTATSRGKSSIDAALKFYVCTEKSCTPQERRLSVPVQVK